MSEGRGHRQQRGRHWRGRNRGISCQHPRMHDHPDVLFLRPGDLDVTTDQRLFILPPSPSQQSHYRKSTSTVSSGPSPPDSQLTYFSQQPSRSYTSSNRIETPRHSNNPLASRSYTQSLPGERCSLCGSRSRDLRSSPTLPSGTTSQSESLPELTNNTSDNTGCRSNEIDLNVPPDFVQWEPQDFEPGKVFEAIWPEYNCDSRDHELFGKVNIFIVVERRYGHVKALCIHTYSHRGSVFKHIQDHCIVYTSDIAPSPLPSEQGSLRPHAIRVLPRDESRSLDRASRINLGRIIAIDHNTKVRDFGIVDPCDLDRLQDQLGMVDMTWRKRRRESNKATKEALMAYKEALNLEKRELAAKEEEVDAQLKELQDMHLFTASDDGLAVVPTKGVGNEPSD